MSSTTKSVKSPWKNPFEPGSIERAASQMEGEGGQDNPAAQQAIAARLDKARQRGRRPERGRADDERQ